MLTAHLPSGYILAKSMTAPTRPVLGAAVLGGIFPDFDLAYFFFLEKGSANHHEYWMHMPLFWVLVAVVILPILAWRGGLKLGSVFFAAILLHLMLDTVVGGIEWGAPFSDMQFRIFSVPMMYSHWTISFLLHWTFLIEVLIWIWAFHQWRRARML